MRIAAHDIGICFMSQMSECPPDEANQRQWDEACRRGAAKPGDLIRITEAEALAAFSPPHSHWVRGET
jgi:hypothetical protein